jgi:hypothetical protein
VETPADLDELLRCLSDSSPRSVLPHRIQLLERRAFSNNNRASHR